MYNTSRCALLHPGFTNLATEAKTKSVAAYENILQLSKNDSWTNPNETQPAIATLRFHVKANHESILEWFDTGHSVY
jgi:hypothetical protein